MTAFWADDPSLLPLGELAKMNIEGFFGTCSRCGLTGHAGRCRVGQVSACAVKKKSVEGKTSVKSRTAPSNRLHKRNFDRYSCMMDCDKSFSTSSSKRRHDRLHTGEMPFQCSVCGGLFYRSDYLKQHQLLCRRNPTQKKKFSPQGRPKYWCPKCGLRFHFRHLVPGHRCRSRRHYPPLVLTAVKR